MLTIAGMAKRKKPLSSDRHKPNKQVRITPRMDAQLQILARRRDTTVPDEVRAAVREYLEKHGLWPADNGGCKSSL